MSEVEMLDFEAFKERYENVPVKEYPNNVREAVPDPVVSVHLLTYNHADYIREAIESVLMQEVDFPMEIVLGDDDSSDGTREICIEYAEKYPDLIRLQLHHRENNIQLHGQPTHLFQYWYNTFSVRGKYVAVLSGDDLWTDNTKIRKQVRFLEKNDKYILCHHDGFVVDSEGEKKMDSQLPEDRKRKQSRKDLMKDPFLITNSLCFRSKSKYPGCITDSFNEDLFLVGFLGQYGKGKYQKNIEPSVYREHEQSIWSSLEWVEKKEKLLNTTRNLMKYYCNLGYNEVCSYHRDLLLRGSYIFCLRRGKYSSAAVYWWRALGVMARNKKYGKMFSFLRHSATMFLGSIKVNYEG